MKTAKKTEKSDITFESALKKLEAIAEKLELGELGLDESIKEFEKGIRFAGLCHEKLEQAERKIEILQKGEGEDPDLRRVRVKNDTGEIEEDEDLQGSLL